MLYFVCLGGVTVTGQTGDQKVPGSNLARCIARKRP